ncbi:uncharacterized protein LOC119109924 [Pollicipes pollicipes]|uniref:uncharacterized protein LOC119109924 n=1 Tax=Pollicipes pollicipes TaxID=41117 RepID=UPI001884BA4A|nr:uncharacterized protein LOC119109924 [Pollicipes pollicipes]
MWRAHVGEEVLRVPSASAVVLACTAAAGGVLTVSLSGQVAMAEAASGAPRWSRRLENVTAAVCDGQRAYLAAGRALHVLRLSDGHSERQLAPDARITSLTCMPEGADDSHLGVAMLGLEDGRVAVALADRGDLVSSLAHAGEVTCLALTSDPILASGGRDGMVLLWTSDDGWRAPVRSLEAFSVPVSALAWLENSLLAAGQDSQLVVYADADKPDSDELTRRVITGNDAPVCSLAVAGNHVLSATAGGQVLLWTSRLVPMHCVASFGDHTADVSSVTVTKNSLLSASLDGSVKLCLDADGALSFTAAGVMPDGVFAVHVTLEPAGGGHHKLDCGADPDPAVMQVRALGTSTLVACDRNGMVCRLEQSERLNVLRLGEFEFASCVRHCALVAAPAAGLPTGLVCGDDRDHATDDPTPELTSPARDPPSCADPRPE